MKKRNPLAVFLLSIVTFGIYDLYWLVKTKKVLNEKTSHHTPTIWMLILPYIILMTGYILLFSASASSTPSATTSTASSVKRTVAPGEQLNTQGTHRPSQYLHLCKTADGIQYVTQGSPVCLGSDIHQLDYSPLVAGTLFSSPCQTNSGTLRYAYISNQESCPADTTLVFYNTLGGSSGLAAVPSSNSADLNNANSQIKHTGLFFTALGLITLGFITTFVATIFWFFKFSKAINEYTRGKMSTAVTFLILWLIHLIGVALIQDTFNDMEEAGPGFGQPAMAAAPAAPAAAPIVGMPTPGIGEPTPPPPASTPPASPQPTAPPQVNPMPPSDTTPPAPSNPANNQPPDNTPGTF